MRNMEQLSQNSAEYHSQDRWDCDGDKRLDHGRLSGGVALVLCAEAGLHGEASHLLLVAVLQHRGTVVILDTCVNKEKFSSLGLAENYISTVEYTILSGLKT